MFGIRLKALRQSHDLSQKELGEILKVSTGTVGNWEVGSRKPDFDMVVRIADLFNVPCDYLLRSPDGDKIIKSIRVNISDIENEMLTEFRTIGEKLGSKGQRAVIDIAKILNSNG